MKKLLLLLAFAAPALAGERQLINPDQDGDLILRVNKGGTPTDAITITGSTANTTIGTTSGASAATVQTYGTLQGYSADASPWALNTTASDAVSALQGLQIFSPPNRSIIVNLRGNSGTSDAFVINTSTANNGVADTTALRVNNNGGTLVIGRDGNGDVITINGFIRFTDSTGGGGGLNSFSFGNGHPGIYDVNTNGGAGSTCTANCGTGATAKGYQAGGTCLMAWTSGNAVSACGTTLVAGKCLCAAID